MTIEEARSVARLMRNALGGQLALPHAWAMLGAAHALGVEFPAFDWEIRGAEIIPYEPFRLASPERVRRD